MPVITKYLALDCEMVGCGPRGSIACLGRVSIVNELGEIVYDTYVKPKELVTDYRTRFSGLTKELLDLGEDFDTVRENIIHLIHNRIVVGHDLNFDLKALRIGIPFHCVIDTAKNFAFSGLTNGQKPSLRFLASKFLGKFIQLGPHDSVEDARTAMEIIQAASKISDMNQFLNYEPSYEIKNPWRFGIWQFLVVLGWASFVVFLFNNS